MDSLEKDKLIESALLRQALEKEPAQWVDPYCEMTREEGTPAVHGGDS